jgi:hypothetical protein
VNATIREHTAELETVALNTTDEGRARMLILPIHPQGDAE